MPAMLKVIRLLVVVPVYKVQYTMRNGISCSSGDKEIPDPQECLDETNWKHLLQNSATLQEILHTVDDNGK